MCGSRNYKCNFKYNNISRSVHTAAKYRRVCTFNLQSGVWPVRCIVTIYFYRYTISLVVVHILYIRRLLLYESGKQENEKRKKRVKNEQRRRWMCLCGKQVAAAGNVQRQKNER